MRIAVMGAGGVGGFYGAKLAEAGHDVVLIARGQHLEAIREHGLTIENLSDGRVSRSAVAVTDNPASIDRADLILFAVKLWDTGTAIDLVAPIVDEETTLLSLQNGVIKDLILKARFGDKAVLGGVGYVATAITRPGVIGQTGRSEEHTSELQSLMRISYAVFCLKKKIIHKTRTHNTNKQNSH